VWLLLVPLWRGIIPIGHGMIPIPDHRLHVIGEVKDYHALVFHLCILILFFSP
jgi:hypothetical protein